MQKCALIAATIILAATATPAAAGSSDVVNVAQGKLRGQTSGAVTAFKGIPFAAPPVGAARWRPPAAPAKWDGVRDATRYGPGCIQPILPDRAFEQSEDCLTLNVWRPATTRPGAKLPVMVWIHGGAFTIGSNSDPVYDGTHYAERGVVLININYRLGLLGYFVHPALTTENPHGDLANFALMDAIAALKWVKANVAAFGGDPANVTIFGESAGGVTVNALMTSPKAQGLFHRAISESAFNRLQWRPFGGEGNDTAEKIGVEFAARHGIEGAGPDAAQALRNLPAKDVAGMAIGGGTSGTLPLASPILDGKYLIENVEEAFAAGREAKVPFLTGGNSAESSLVPAIAKNPDRTLAALGPLRARVEKAYAGSGDPVTIAQDVKTDVSSTEPVRHLARLHAANGQKAYAYYFSYMQQALRQRYPRVPHGWELGYVFNTLPDKDIASHGYIIPAATAQDKAMADAVIRYWINFAKTGDPGNVAGVTWNPISPDSFFLEFGPDTITAQPNFMREKLDALENAPASMRPPRPD